MLMRLCGAQRERQSHGDNCFVPRLEPLEERLTPSSLPPLNPVVSNQLTASALLLAQQQNVQPPSNQLNAAFVFIYIQTARQSPADTNALVRADAVLVADLELFALDAQLKVTDPSFNTPFINVQDAIVNNPVRNTSAGMALSVLEGSLGLNALTSPSTQSLAAAFQLSYSLATQQNASHPEALNGLVEAEVALTLDQIFERLDPLLGINDPTLSADHDSLENAIATNPTNATTFALVTGQLTRSLIINTFSAPV